MNRRTKLALLAATLLVVGLAQVPWTLDHLVFRPLELDSINQRLLLEQHATQSQKSASLSSVTPAAPSRDVGSSIARASTRELVGAEHSAPWPGHGAPQPTFIFPPDDRERITPTTSYPWSTVAKLHMYMNGAIVGVCSGALVDSFHVLTAGHCVYFWKDSVEVGWVDSVRVTPGADSGYAPFGDAWATRFRTYVAWTENADPRHDWALLTLDWNIGQLTGWMGLLTTDPADSVYFGDVETAGYPGDLDEGQNMYHAKAEGCGADDYIHYTWLDTAEGQSGSPVWRSDISGPYVVSILAYSSNSLYACNWATRLDGQKFDDILAWSAADSPPDGSTDMVPPRTAGRLLGTEGDNGWFRSSVTITLSAIDASGIALTYYRLDGSSWASYIGPITVTDDGSHILEYYSIDRAGNTEALQHDTFGIDSHAPVDLRILTPTEGIVVNSASVNVSWSVTDWTSGISHYRVQLDEDDEIEVGAQAIRTFRGLSDGDHAVRIVAIDFAGNQAEVKVHFRVDTNILSASGPYGPWLLGILIAGVATGTVTLGVWLVRRRVRQVPISSTLALQTPGTYALVSPPNICPRCQSSAPPGAYYCGRCGQTLLRRLN